MSTQDEIKRIAKLSRLELSEAEMPELEKRLSAILDHVQRLEAVLTDDIAPMAHAALAGNVLREDTPAPSLDPTGTLANSADTEGPHFRVPRTVK